MKLKTKNLLTLGELSKSELAKLIDESIKFKKEFKKRNSKDLLKNKTLAMIFLKPSTRTRVSFEVGMFQLGGHSINLPSSDMQLSRGEAIEDTAKTLSRYTDCILARVYEHDTVKKIAENSSIPVINGLSDSFHPCQIIADFMTIKEKKGKLKGLKICWIGDGNNVCNSMMYGAALTDMKMSVATPKGYEPDKAVIKEAKKQTEIDITTDPNKAIKNADIVVTDTFSSIHNKDPKRIEKFIPKFQVTSTLMKKSNSNSIFMHCLPAKRGQEVTSEVIDGSQSVVWDEAENRLHSQKALLVSLIRA